MAPLRIFKLALVDLVYPQQSWFDAGAKDTIKATLRQHLDAVKKAMPKDVVTNVDWSFRAEHVATHDVVIYFVLDRDHSVIRSELKKEPPPEAQAGATALDQAKGNLSEVYVDGTMPARRVANVAFHEFMHNKLKKDDRELHKLDGLADYPTTENANPSKDNIVRLSKALFRPRRQYTGSM